MGVRARTITPFTDSPGLELFPNGHPRTTMSGIFKIGSRQAQFLVSALLRLGVLFLPTLLLLGAALRHPGANDVLLWTGTVFQAVVCGLTFVSRRSWRQP